MGLWTRLLLALQLLLKLCWHVEAQALGECDFKWFNLSLMYLALQAELQI